MSVDGKPVGGLLKDPNQTVAIDKLSPGQTVVVAIAAIPKDNKKTPEIIHSVKVFFYLAVFT